MEPRMLDKINDLKRIKSEALAATFKYEATKKTILSECKEILERAELTADDLSSYMTPF